MIFVVVIAIVFIIIIVIILTNPFCYLYVNVVILLLYGGCISQPSIFYACFLISLFFFFCKCHTGPRLVEKLNSNDKLACQKTREDIENFEN